MTNRTRIIIGLAVCFLVLALVALVAFLTLALKDGSDHQADIDKINYPDYYKDYSQAFAGLDCDQIYKMADQDAGHIPSAIEDVFDKYSLEDSDISQQLAEISADENSDQDDREEVWQQIIKPGLEDRFVNYPNSLEEFMADIEEIVESKVLDCQ